MQQYYSILLIGMLLAIAAVFFRSYKFDLNTNLMQPSMAQSTAYNNYNAAHLNSATEEILKEALADEYKAYATYDSIIKKQGDINPFANIIKAEERHISALKSLFDKYDIEVPANNLVGDIAVSDSNATNCKTAADLERSNYLLYKDKLIPAVRTNIDMLNVFQNLAWASEYRHLPALINCQ